jgi:hypothetical protein
MTERQPIPIQAIAGIVAAGAILTGCGTDSGESRPATTPAGHSESYGCNAHMYKLGEITVSVSGLNYPFEEARASKIRVQLPGEEPTTKQANEKNRAAFEIPRNYSQIFVQAAVHKHWVACSTIFKRDQPK